MAWYCISFGLIAWYHTVLYRCYSAPANYRVVHLVIFYVLWHGLFAHFCSHQRNLLIGVYNQWTFLNFCRRKLAREHSSFCKNLPRRLLFWNVAFSVWWSLHCSRKRCSRAASSVKLWCRWFALNSAAVANTTFPHLNVTEASTFVTKNIEIIYISIIASLSPLSISP